MECLPKGSSHFKFGAQLFLSLSISLTAPVLSAATTDRCTERGSPQQCNGVKAGTNPSNRTSTTTTFTCGENHAPPTALYDRTNRNHLCSN